MMDAEQPTDCEVCGHKDHYAGVYASAYVPYSGRLCFPCGAVRAEAKWIEKFVNEEVNKELSIVTYKDNAYFQKGKVWISRDEVIEKLKSAGKIK